LAARENPRNTSNPFEVLLGERSQICPREERLQRETTKKKGGRERGGLAVNRVGRAWGLARGVTSVIVYQSVAPSLDTVTFEAPLPK
jgi:hypothetical protein